MKFFLFLWIVFVHWIKNISFDWWPILLNLILVDMSSSQFVMTAGSTALMTSLTILVSRATKPRKARAVRCKQMKKTDHLPRNSENSGWYVNGTQVFRAFHWKVPGNKWNFWKGRPAFPLEIQRRSVTSRYHGSTISGWQQNQRWRRRQGERQKMIRLY